MAFSSNTLQNYEQTGYGGPNLSMQRAAAQQIISEAVATRTLVAKEAGSLCLFDIASGVVYTLPTPAATTAGMWFEFATTTTITSNAAKVITDAATTFILGAITLVNNAATTAENFAANGTTIRAISSNGTTTGGIIGDRFRLTALSATVWLISGVLSNTGTAATPFATS